MTLYQFNAMDEMEQIETVWEYGTHISERDDSTFRYILYGMQFFFVELKYNREHNVLVGSRAFKTETLLEPYLPNIDISEILKEL